MHAFVYIYILVTSQLSYSRYGSSYWIPTDNESLAPLMFLVLSSASPLIMKASGSWKIRNDLSALFKAR